jgi:hypothetical protein
MDCFSADHDFRFSVENVFLMLKAVWIFILKKITRGETLLLAGLVLIVLIVYIVTVLFVIKYTK